jgi:hypothetical protein
MKFVSWLLNYEPELIAMFEIVKSRHNVSDDKFISFATLLFFSRKSNTLN